MMGDAEALDALAHGEVEIEGRMPWSSNTTLLCTLRGDFGEQRAVYKPRRGERPLWDFPAGLDQREVAAYELSRWLGWDLVPPTILRDGPLGIGSLQLFVDADFDHHYFTLLEDPRHHDALRAICVFDLVSNNTDRKGGHCLLASNGRIYGIDHGLSFHREFKLRTVIWDFAGEPIPTPLLDGLACVSERGLPPVFDELLDPFERDAVRSRAAAVHRAGVFPADETGHRYPWPLV